MIVEMLSYYNNDSKPDLVDSFFGQIFLALNYLPDLFVIPSFSIYGWLVLLLFLLGLVQLTNFNHASTSTICLLKLANHLRFEKQILFTLHNPGCSYRNWPGNWIWYILGR